MKFLVDCHCFDYPTPEGVNTYLKGLYVGLFEHAKDIEFVMASTDTDNLRAIFGESQNVSYVRIPNCGTLSRLMSVYPSVIKRQGIDAAHFQYITPLPSRCKTVVTLHDVLFKDFPQYFPAAYRLSRQILFKRSAQQANRLLTVSEYSRSRISANFGISPDRITVTPNMLQDRYSGIDVREARKSIREEYGFDRYILYVSRTEPRKNHSGLIDAFIESRLYEEGYELVMAGHASAGDASVRREICSLPSVIGSHIHLLGGVDDSMLPTLYRGASLFVYPSQAEGFGIPPLEAALAGVPVICNNVTAMADYDFFGDSLTDTSDKVRLASAMRKKLAEPADGSRLANIKKEIIRRFGNERIHTDFLKILRSL